MENCRDSDSEISFWQILVELANQVQKFLARVGDILSVEAIKKLLAYLPLRKVLYVVHHLNHLVQIDFFEIVQYWLNLGEAVRFELENFFALTGIRRCCNFRQIWVHILFIFTNTH